jgi:probable F420-dependent oxidoreductase
VVDLIGDLASLDARIPLEQRILDHTAHAGHDPFVDVDIDWTTCVTNPTDRPFRLNAHCYSPRCRARRLGPSTASLAQVTKPFRFGCQYFAPRTAADWTETVRRAESLGFSTLHIADHYLGPGPALDAAAHPVQSVAAIPAMATAAAVSDTINVGSRVLCVDYHHPVVLAKELATIDMLSGGRLEVGLGAGWINSEYEALGIDMDRAGVRLDRLAEVVGLLRSWFAGGELNVVGDHVHATGFKPLPKVASPPGPKIMIGGGAQRVLTMAGALADIVSINFDNSSGALGPAGVQTGSADATDAKLGWIRAGAGDRYEELEIEIGGYFTTVTDDAAAVAEAMAPMFGMEPQAFRDNPHTWIGSVDEICELAEQRRERFDINYITIGAEVMEDFAPVVERLSGR